MGFTLEKRSSEFGFNRIQIEGARERNRLIIFETILIFFKDAKLIFNIMNLQNPKLWRNRLTINANTTRTSTAIHKCTFRRRRCHKDRRSSTADNCMRSSRCGLFDLCRDLMGMIAFAHKLAGVLGYTY